MRILLLPLISIFIFVQNFAEYHPPKGAQRQGKSPQELVPAQKRLYSLEQTSTPQSAQGASSAPQSRSKFPTSNHQSNGHGLFQRSEHGVFSVEMSVWTHQQKVVYRMCCVLCTMDQRDEAFHTAQIQESQAARVIWLACLFLGRLEQLGGQSIAFNKPVVDQIQLWCRGHYIYKPGLCFSDANQDERKYEREERKEGERSIQAKRPGFTLSGRDEELCPLGHHGHFCIYSLDDLIPESFCSCRFLKSPCSEPRMGRCFAQSVPRSKFDAGRNTYPCRESRKGLRKERHQELTSSKYLFGQGQRSPQRGYRPSSCSPRFMDEAYGGGSSDLGTTVRGLQKTPSFPDGTSGESQKRDHGYKPDHSTTEPCSWRSICSSNSPGSSNSGDRRPTRRDSRQGGRGNETEPSGGAEKLCQLFRSRHRATESRGDSRRLVPYGRQTAKKTKIFGAVWWCWQSLLLKHGRVLGVECNPRHEAELESALGTPTDAYWSSFAVTDAACSCTDNPFQPFLPMKHSVCGEPRFVSEFKAVSDALCLQWEVSKNLYNDFCCTPICRNFPFPFPWMPSHRPHSGPTKKLQVKFDDQIDVWIGIDDSLEMCRIRLLEKSIQNWDEKPWSKQRVRNKKDQAPLSEMAVLSRSLHDDMNDFFFQVEFPTVPEAEQFCPPEEHLCHGDETYMVQFSQMKHSTFSDQEVIRLTAFNEGQAAPTDQELQGGASDEAGSSDTNPDSMSSNSDVRPPSSTQGRQEVIMFHLMDPPIRALLDWSDYDRMIAEIALHFSTTPINVVDAYEINTELSGYHPTQFPSLCIFCLTLPLGIRLG